MANTTQGPAITSANLPKPPAPPVVPTAVQATAAATVSAVMDDNIVAAPLVDPDFAQNIKPKNPEVALRWVLYNLGMRDGATNYLRFEKAKTQGFFVCTQADLINPPMAYARDNGSKFINGDLILMKIDRRKYKGAVLHREQQAAKAMLATRQAGKDEVRRGIAQAPPSQRSKISTFDPTEKDLSTFAEIDPDKQDE